MLKTQGIHFKSNELIRLCIKYWTAWQASKRNRWVCVIQVRVLISYFFFFVFSLFVGHSAVYIFMHVFLRFFFFSFPFLVFISASLCLNHTAIPKIIGKTSRQTDRLIHRLTRAFLRNKKKTVKALRNSQALIRTHV